MAFSDYGLSLDLLKKESMNRFLSLIFCFVFLTAAVSLGRDEPLANENTNGLYVKSIEQVLRLGEEDLDLATAVLIICEEWNVDVQGLKYRAQLDDMALDIRSRLKEQKIPADYRAIPVINKLLFDELGFKSVKQANNPDDLFLHSVLDNKQGYCLSLSVLYLSLSERLGLPLYGVVVPGHFFVRYDDGRIRFNIETTSNGGNAPDEHYITKFNVPEDSSENIYMTNLGKRQTLGCFFNNLGNSYSDIGDTEQAQLALERAVQINPFLTESRTNLGNVYLKQKKTEDAIYQYRMALKNNPKDAISHNNLANAYAEQGWVNDAISEYSTAIDLDPNFIDSYQNLAILCCKEELFNQAITLLDQALRKQPENAKTYANLGDVYCRMEDYENAIPQYKKALNIKSDMAQAHYSLGICYNKLGSSEKEIEAFEKALNIEPDMVAARVNLGNAYFAKQKYDLAITHYKKALYLSPNDGTTHCNLAAAYFNKDDYKLALTEYSTAVEIDPQMAIAHNGLALVYYKMEKYQSAWKHIQLAEQLGYEIDKKLLAAIEDKV